MDCGRVIAFVLTYNRKELVTKCLRAIVAQSEAPDAILVIDNGSIDGTREHLQRHGLLQQRTLSYFSVPQNIGPAAGFDLGIRTAYRWGYDWLWIMDDDTIPDPDALKELKAAFTENFSSASDVGFLASRIVSGDGKPNNVPDIDVRAPDGQPADWANLLGRGLVKVRWSTLCSVLIPRSTFTAVGGISPDFFFSGDDIDFTLRVTAMLPGYLVGRSVVTHLRAVSGLFSVLRERDPERIRMFWYSYRNQFYIRRKYYSFARVILYTGKSGWELVQALATKPHRLLRAASIVRGLVAGVFFRPRHRPINAPIEVSGGTFNDHSQQSLTSAESPTRLPAGIRSDNRQLG